jgi:hypothetical protein
MATLSAERAPVGVLRRQRCHSILAGQRCSFERRVAPRSLRTGTSLGLTIERAASARFRSGWTLSPSEPIAVELTSRT